MALSTREFVEYPEDIAVPYEEFCSNISEYCTKIIDGEKYVLLKKNQTMEQWIEAIREVSTIIVVGERFSFTSDGLAVAYPSDFNEFCAKIQDPRNSWTVLHSTEFPEVLIFRNYVNLLSEIDVKRQVEHLKYFGRHVEVVNGQTFSAVSISSNFAEFYQQFVQRPAKESTELIYATRRAYFSTFEDSQALICDFSSYLAFCKNTYYSVYSNLISVVQSSGFGKSKLAMEIGSRVHAIITSGENLCGFPSTSTILKKFLNFLERVTIESGGYMAIEYLIILVQNYFIRLLFYSWEALKVPKRGILIDELFKNDNLFEKKIFYGVEDFIKRPKPHLEHLTPRSSKLHLIEDIDGKINEQSLHTCVSSIIEARDCTRTNLAPVLFVIDEATCLLEKYSGRTLCCREQATTLRIDFYRLFQRSIRYSSFFWDNCFLCLISTTSLISNILPSQADDPSWRPQSGIGTKVLPPYTPLKSFDCFARDFFLIGTPRCGVQDWKEHICSVKQMVTSLLCGRPLFGVMAANVIIRELSKSLSASPILFCKPTDLVQIVSASLVIDEKATANAICNAIPEVFYNCARKYIRLESFEKGESSFDAIDTAFKTSLNSSMKWLVLSLSVVTFQVPAFIDIEEMVRSKMAILVAANDEKKRHAITYLSEGTPNALFSWLLEKNMAAILRADANMDSRELLASLIQPSGSMLESVGETGKVISRIGLLVSILRTKPKILISRQGDNAQVADVLYAPRDLFAFITTFAGANVSEELRGRRKDLEGSLIMFNHFHQSLESGSPDDLCRAMLYRCSARVFSNDQHGADLILPLLLADGTCSLVVVQVNDQMSLDQSSAAFDLESVLEKGVVRDIDRVREGCKRLGERYLRIILNVASNDDINAWRVSIDDTGIAGLVCVGNPFECLTEAERRVLESFRKIGLSNSLLTQNNPQLFGNMNTPPCARYTNFVCTSVIGNNQVFVNNPLNKGRVQQFFSKYNESTTETSLVEEADENVLFFDLTNELEV